MSSHKMYVIFFQILLKISCENFLKIFPVVAELFHADIGWQTDVMKLTVAFTLIL
jgi:hypothetical protein